MEGLVVSCERTVLSERKVANLTPKGPHSDVPLVVYDQVRALVEGFATLSAIRADKQALKVRLVASSTRGIDLDLLIGMLGQNSKASIVLTFRNGRSIFNRWCAPSANSPGHDSIACGLLLMFGVRHRLCPRRVIAARGGSDALGGALIFLMSLPLDMGHISSHQHVFDEISSLYWKSWEFAFEAVLLSVHVG